jgi:hypothetical protein
VVSHRKEAAADSERSDGFDTGRVPRMRVHVFVTGFASESGERFDSDKWNNTDSFVADSEPHARFTLVLWPWHRMNDLRWKRMMSLLRIHSIGAGCEATGRVTARVG